jgi:hypothetical protein
MNADYYKVSALNNSRIIFLKNFAQIQPHHIRIHFESFAI